MSVCVAVTHGYAQSSAEPNRFLLFLFVSICKYKIINTWYYKHINVCNSDSQVNTELLEI